MNPGIVSALSKSDALQELGESLLGPSSKPKTDSNLPKHGKEDEKNEPHVGGNTWAGGSGGSDTAGLGGRGRKKVSFAVDLQLF